MPAVLAPQCAAQFEKWAYEQRDSFFIKFKQVHTCTLQIMNTCKQYKRDLHLTASTIKESMRLRVEQQMTDVEQTIRIVNNSNTRINTVMHKLKTEVQEAKYTKIPGFALASGAAFKRWGRMKCQIFCDRRPTCKSYSYNVREQSCMWSASTIAYDDNYVLYTKTSDMGKTPFVAISGMRIGVAPAGKGHTTISECQYKCVKAKECTGVAYSALDNQCIILVLPIAIGSSWNYYEKQNRQVVAKMQRKLMELRQAKMTLSIKHLIHAGEDGAVDRGRKDKVSKQKLQDHADFSLKGGDIESVDVGSGKTADGGAPGGGDAGTVTAFAAPGASAVPL